MPGLSRNLKQLEKELLALGEETMLVEELDGFLAGLLVCPELIKPGEWLPIVWGQHSDDPQSTFDNLEHVNRVLGLLMEHYNDVARTLMDRPARYSPVFAVDQRNGDILWELWIAGFEKAVDLRPATWKSLLNIDADTATAMRGMLMLIEIAGGNPTVPPRDRDTLCAMAPDDIARWVVTLYESRLANSVMMQDTLPMSQSPFSSVRKVGRNDPCPCGSGKKFKKCCGLQ